MNEDHISNESLYVSLENNCTILFDDMHTMLSNMFKNRL